MKPSIDGVVIGKIVREAARALVSVSKTPDLDARILARYAFDLSDVDLISKADCQVSSAKCEDFQEMVERRKGGVPVSRIVGSRGFWDFDLTLTPDVLDPRPDTEILVEKALEALPNPDGPYLGCDLGTGSGAIALAILRERPRMQIVAIDLSGPALHVAQRNARSAGVGDRFFPVRGSWLNAVKASFDLIVSNPPYIPTKDIEELDIEVRDHDPKIALDGGADGLDPYRVISEQSPSRLKGGGSLLAECGRGQADEVARLLATGFDISDDNVERHNDLAGIARVVIARKCDSSEPDF